MTKRVDLLFLHIQPGAPKKTNIYKIAKTEKFLDIIFLF